MTYDAHSESERRTRKQRIDPMLRAVGWTIVPFDESKSLTAYANHAIEEYPTANGPADYALCLDGRLVGVIEAKKLTVGPQGVLTQAERYARGIADSPFNIRDLRVPFLYSTNGERVRFHDIRHPLELSRWIDGFHTPAALREFLDRDADSACAWLAANQNWHQRLRPYQIEANQAIERAIADRKRQMLVAMATGTGKTFTLVNQVYRLMKSGAGRRILFLVDRRALAAQAVRAFASFEPEPGLKFDKIYEVYSQRFQREDFDSDDKFDPNVLPTDYLHDPSAKHAFVYVCTIQRMAINLLGRGAVFDLGDDEPIDDDAEQIPIPIHAFDVVIADECHRGYTTAQVSIWRQVLDHLDGIRIGLTATPAAHTKAYFNNVVFRYEYERAVREGHLVDYDVVKLKSDVRMAGMFLREGEQVALVDPESGGEQRDLLEDEREYAQADIERKATSPDSNRKIIQEIKRHADEHEQRTGRFPKTLIFAANDLPHTSHADQIVEMCREVFGRGESFVQKITGRVDRPLQRIREFRNRREPGIVVSVDLMSTGVDIPDLEFIVFLRPVKSRILFEQMLGRGTRKGEHSPDKSHFVVFDCFDGTLLQYFKQSTSITAEPPDKPSRTIQQLIEGIWQNRDRDYNIRCLVKRLQRIDKEMDGSARDLFAAHGIPEREDFVIATSNKQLNFLQHVMTILKPGGRAAVVVPDNCLFADQAGEVFKILTEDCDLHTVLRLPNGTFTPYSPGTKTNVVFFTRGYATETVWIYDGRTNVPRITKKDRPLTAEYFREFERCYGPDPNGRGKRSETDSPKQTGWHGGDRWHSFHISEIKARDFKIDSLKWLRDESLDDSDELPEPEELATEAIGELEAAVEELSAVMAMLENGNGSGVEPAEAVTA